MSIICQALEGLQLTEDFCANFAKTLKFSYGQHLTFALALSLSSTSAVQQQGMFPLQVPFSHRLPQGSPQLLAAAVLGHPSFCFFTGTPRRLGHRDTPGTPLHFFFCGGTLRT